MRVWNRIHLAPHRNPSVLCVDDDPGVLASLRRLLHREPYGFHAASSARKALLVIDRHPVSLVLADHRMPEMCGADLLCEVRRRSPRIRRVMLTGYPSSFRIQVGLGEEIEWIIGKPWNDAALKQIIRWLVAWQGRPRLAPPPQRA